MSKFLGGDLSTTHLVKGLDVNLLKRAGYPALPEAPLEPDALPAHG